jgi:hypothetical protein
MDVIMKIIDEFVYDVFEELGLRNRSKQRREEMKET